MDPGPQGRPGADPWPPGAQDAPALTKKSRGQAALPWAPSLSLLPAPDALLRLLPAGGPPGSPLQILN